MPREVVVLPSTGEYWQVESAARLLGWLAYPGPSERDKKRRTEFFNYAACAWFAEKARRDPDWAWKPQLLAPALLLVPQRKIEPILRRAEEIIATKRLLAGGMLGPVLGSIYAPPWLAVGVNVDGEFKPANVTNLAAHTAEMRGSVGTSRTPEEAGRDVLSRVWTPSKPVLHLAMALNSYIFEKCNGLLPMTENLIEKMPVKTILGRAEWIRHEMLCSQKFEIAELETVKFE